MNADASNPIPTIIFFIYVSLFPVIIASRNLKYSSNTQLYDDDSITYIWPLPSEFSFGNQTLAVDPNLSLAVSGNGGGSAIVKEAFERYKSIIFKHHSKLPKSEGSYDIEKLNVIVYSANEELQLGVDESYSLSVAKRDEHSIIGEITIEANFVYGALRGLEVWWIIVDICMGVGYPDLWPSPSCKEPLDVSKNFTFDVISGILADMRKVFPFELFHLGGDEVHTDCWTSTPPVKQWLQDHNMTGNDAYQYFVLRAQKIVASLNWTPVNWEETFNTFPTKLNPQTVVHNWLGSGVCPKAVAKGFRCIFSNQGVWYLDHLDIPWSTVYYADPLEGITDVSEQKLVLGGEACMWAEKADASNVQQTIWPRAAAVAERLWSNKESASSENSTTLQRLEYFRCLLTRRGVQAAPVTNFYARSPPTGPGSCYEQ
ncbi:unnamed protein product [Fraxinus pennsylvanica]|uniref:beta-N-acetylhexosaminidase n=1 Tax=Fraxinus pennsylvanica TaxID=56036 RepID=A0AAD1ZD12_9LAMI|nr:unnamed protein product [Fraxinus pennsylvanica]